MMAYDYNFETRRYERSPSKEMGIRQSHIHLEKSER